MSLLDFDDDTGVNPTVNSSLAFNGHTSIDDPFGFDVFGTGSAGNKQTTVVTERIYSENANANSMFDNFDPLATFGDSPNQYEVTHDKQVVVTTTTTSSTSVSSPQQVVDQFDMFGAFSTTDEHDAASVKTTATAHSWANATSNKRTDPFNETDFYDAEDKTQYTGREGISEEKQESVWKTNTMGERDEDFEKNRFRSDDPRDEAGEDEDEDLLENRFLGDLKERNRGRINLDEIRQRAYEDVSPVNHNQNKREQKSAAEKAPVVYVLGAATDNNICKVCSKRVYEMEKVTADLQVYHKACFRCNHCNRILSLGNFSANDGRLYCKPHFIEIFKTKGNYKDSFALAEQQRLQGGEMKEDEIEGHQRRRNPSDDISGIRKSSSSADYYDENERGYDESDAKEEVPVVPIKSVRCIFEKMSQDQSQQSVQLKPGRGLTGSTQTDSKRHFKLSQAERASHDSERSELEREKSVERKDSADEREIIQSSTACIIEDELPPPSLTKSMLAKFKMMEDVSGNSKSPVNYGKPISSKQTPSGSTDRNHQTLSYRSSDDSRGSNDPATEKVHSGRSNVDMTARSHSQDNKDEDRTDELPQAGLAKSLLAQWRNLEEQSNRGRNRELKKTSNARRSQSMSRVETVQRSRLYPSAEFGSSRSKQEEDLKRESHSDQENNEDDDLPVSLSTRQRLAKFKEMEGEFVPERRALPKTKKTFRWEVKEAVPLNRGGLIVHGDVPKRPSAEEAVTAEAARSIDASLEYGSQERESRRRSIIDEEDSGIGGGLNQNLDGVVHGTTVTVINEDELPPPATTKTLLQHFKSMEDVTKAPPRPGLAPALVTRDSAPKAKPYIPASTIDTYVEEDLHGYEPRHQSVINSGDSEYTQYVGSSDSGEFGNDPVHDPSILRESNRSDEEEMPAEGTTRSLLAKFQFLQTKH